MTAVAHERRFGVEIECGYREGTYDDVRRAMNEAGFPVAGSYYQDGSHRSYSVGRDGSGVEVRTPILKGQDGFKELKRVFKFLNDFGCYTSERDGMHVHHDAPELVRDPRITLNLVKSWVQNRDAICEMVTPYRKRAMGPWRSDEILRLEAVARGEDTYTRNGYTYSIGFGRNELNVAALQEHGSIEFRLHEGTLNIDDAIAWIKFGQRFMDSVIKRAGPIKPVQNREQLLNRIRLSKTEQTKLDAKRARLRGAA